MKKHVIIVMMMLSIVMYSQKKKNGKIYSEHPAIGVVEAMQQALIKGDTIALSNALHDDFKAFNGMNDNPDSKGVSKEDMLRQSTFWVNNASYLSVKRSKGAYPDALEYDESGVWVQTWDQLKGVHNKTGVKLNMPIHRLFKVDDDNKILTMITYDDGTVFQTLRQGFSTRTNGKLYDQHENINTVRKMVAALEYGDVEKAFSHDYFTEDVRFTNLDMKSDEFNTLEDEKSNFIKMLEKWDIEAIDVRGYPDYLEYERGNSKLVQSWWNFRVKRKSDDKKITIPVMLVHGFNDDGKIIYETGYYTAAQMMKK